MFLEVEGVLFPIFKKLIADGAKELPITDPKNDKILYYFRRWSQLCIEKL